MNPCDSHLLEGHIGLVKIGTASWTDRSLIDSERYFSRGMQGRRPGIGRGGCPKSGSDSVPGGPKLASEIRVPPLTGTRVGLTPEERQIQR